MRTCKNRYNNKLIVITTDNACPEDRQYSLKFPISVQYYLILINYYWNKNIGAILFRIKYKPKNIIFYIYSTKE